MKDYLKQETIKEFSFFFQNLLSSARIKINDLNRTDNTQQKSNELGEDQTSTANEVEFGEDYAPPKKRKNSCFWNGFSLLYRLPTLS